MVLSCNYRVSKKNVVSWKNSHNYPQALKLIQNANFGGVLENSGYLRYQMGAAEIFKTEEEMTEKTKHKVANPPPKMGRIHCSQYAVL